MVNLRLATMADSDRLLEWRNDPGTVANSLTAEPVTPEHHAKWMDRWVRRGFPESLILIIEGAIGVVRFEARARWIYEVSITIAPEHRNLRWGREALAAACAPMGSCELIAQVKAANIASQRIFEHSGFVPFNSGGGVVDYRKDRCWVP